MKAKYYLVIVLIFFITNIYAQNTSRWAIAIHGGAGKAPQNISPEKIKLYEASLNEALSIGSALLNSGANAVDVAQIVVEYLENCPLFNAGKGAVKNIDGIHELDAAIMDGKTLKAGAVAGLRHIKNPIKLARLVMDSTQHVFLIGDGAEQFAKTMNLDFVDNSYFSTSERDIELEKIKLKQREPNPTGTVGCVVRDGQGNLAAATSTGGMSGKRWGRVGDVPIIGAGTYANNNTVAVSGTGHGEYWIRRVVAFDISALVEYCGLTLQRASEKVIFDKISPMGGSGGGIIAVDKDCNISIVFNTSLMHRGWAKSSGERYVGVLK